MLAGVLLATVGSAFAATAPAKKASETPKHYSEWLTRSEMQRVPESYMLDFSNRPKWSYVMGIELESMLDTYLKYGGDDIKDYCIQYTDTMISPDGVIRGYKLLDYNLDNVRTGHFVTRMYQHFPENKKSQGDEHPHASARRTAAYKRRRLLAQGDICLSGLA